MILYLTSRNVGSGRLDSRTRGSCLNERRPVRIGIWKCWLFLKEENRRTRRKPSEQAENQQQTKLTRDAECGNRRNPGHRSGARASAYPLRHPCSQIGNTKGHSRVSGECKQKTCNNSVGKIKDFYLNV